MMNNVACTTLSVAAVVIGMSNVSPLWAQSTANTTLEDERRFFDFLEGDWVLDEREMPNGDIIEGDDTYSFRPVLDGAGIYSDWYFNRGTAENPNYTKGIYLTAYDEMSNSWSFYYVSPENAMYYEGRKENGNWNFYKTFNIDGDEFLQRQNWVLEDSVLIRTIENSRDDGETWPEKYVRRLKKK